MPKASDWNMEEWIYTRVGRWRVGSKAIECPQTWNLEETHLNHKGGVALHSRGISPDSLTCLKLSQTAITCTHGLVIITCNLRDEKYA